MNDKLSEVDERMMRGREILEALDLVWDVSPAGALILKEGRFVLGDADGKQCGVLQLRDGCAAELPLGVFGVIEETWAAVCPRCGYRLKPEERGLRGGRCASCTVMGARKVDLERRALASMRRVHVALNVNFTYCGLKLSDGLGYIRDRERDIDQLVNCDECRDMQKVAMQTRPHRYAGPDVRQTGALGRCDECGLSAHDAIHEDVIECAACGTRVPLVGDENWCAQCHVIYNAEGVIVSQPGHNGAALRAAVTAWPVYRVARQGSMGRGHYLAGDGKATTDEAQAVTTGFADYAAKLAAEQNELGVGWAGGEWKVQARGYCGVWECPCGPGDPPHEAGDPRGAIYPQDYQDKDAADIRAFVEGRDDVEGGA